MDIRIRGKLNRFRRSFSRSWYKMMNPLAKYITNQNDKKYMQIKANLTEEEAVKFIAKDIANFVAKRREPVEFIVAENVDTSVTGGYSYRGLSWKLKNNKAKIGYSKFSRDTSFQLKILVELAAIKGIIVESTKWKPEQWMQVKGFYGWYVLKLKDGDYNK